MACRKRKRRMRSLMDILKEDGSYSGPAGISSLWSQLPIDILVTIALLLEKEDAVELCATCKSWALVAPLIRQSKDANHPVPLLLLPPQILGGDGTSTSTTTTCELFDVTRRKTHFIQVPTEILIPNTTELLYSKDGWLLASGNKNKTTFFFFNPFTQHKIHLTSSFPPRCNNNFLCAFSSQPLLPDCLVFFIRPYSPYSNRVRIEMYRVHTQKMMTDATFRNQKPFKQDPSTNPVFCNGYFYCLGRDDGKLGVFNPTDLVWTICSPGCGEAEYLIFINKARVKYLIQSRGELFVACEAAGAPRVIRVFWLERSKMKWTEVKKLEKRMLFLDSHSSFLAGTSHLDDDPYNTAAGNRIFFPRMRRYTRKCCLSYSLDTCRYHPSRELFECTNFDSDMVLKPVWIESVGFYPAN